MNKEIIVSVIKNPENDKNVKWFFSFDSGKRIVKVIIYDELTKKVTHDAYDSLGNGWWNLFFNQQIYVRSN